MNDENAILTYYQGIRDGSITVGKWIRMLYEIIVDGLENKRWYFDQRKASNAIRFMERFCHHNKGPLAPQRLTLSLWERAAISDIFGIVDADGLRQFTEVLWVIGRKQGKTIIAGGGIGTYMAYAAGEYGSEIYYLAPKLDQADLCFSAFQFNVDKEPDLLKRTKSTKSRGLFIKETNTTIKKLPFTDRKSDGYNPMFYVADEIASWPGDRGLKQWEVMVSGTGARREPLGLAISSAGYENDGIFDELFKRGTAFLNGNSREQHLLPLLYMIDDPEKWDDINELRKSLPGLGESVSVKFILKEIDTAHESLSKKTEFLTKYCNIKQNSSVAWLSTETIRRSFNIGDGFGEKLKLITSPKGGFRTPEEHQAMIRTAEDVGPNGLRWQMAMRKAGKITEEGNRLTLEDFNDCYGLAGIDLSQTTDLTACCLLIQRGGVVYYFVRFFIPREKVEEATARDGLPYRKYIERGFLIESGDNFVDYNDCFRWYADLIEKYHIYVMQVGLDRYCAQYLQAQMERYGFHCDTVFQGTNLTGVINTTEGMLKDGTLQSAEDNDLMKIHLLDAALKTEAETNRKKLIKISKRAHVDGVACLLDAMCMRANKWEEMKNRLRNER